MTGPNVIRDEASFLLAGCQKMDVPLDGASRESCRSKMLLCNEIRRRSTHEDRQAASRAALIARNRESDNISIIRQPGFRVDRVDSEDGTNVTPPGNTPPSVEARRQTAPNQALQRRIALNPPLPVA
jgi:hypothetical protein